MTRSTLRKPVVPKPTRALFNAALRVANGGTSARDEAAVRSGLPGHEVVTAARVILLRWFWWQNEAVWHG